MNNQLTKLSLVIFTVGLFSYTIIKKYQLSGSPELILLYFDELFVVAIFIYVLSNFMFYGKIPFDTTDALMLGFIIFGIVSSILYFDEFKVLLFGLFLSIKGYLLYWSFSKIKFNEKNLNVVIKFIKIIGWVAILFGVINLIIPEEFSSFMFNQKGSSMRAGLNIINSFFVDSGVTGWFMAMVFFLYYSEYVFLKKTKLLIKSTPFIIMLILSLRMKPIIGLVFTVLYVLLSNNVKIKNRASLMLFTSLLLIIALGIFYEPIVEVVEKKARIYIYSADTTNIARNMLYIKGFEIAYDKFPFGAGFGKYGGHVSKLYYSSIYFEYGLNETYGLRESDSKFMSDTFWPNIIGETGYLGCLFYILFFISVYRKIVIKLKYSNNININIFLLFSVCVLIESLFESIAMPIYSKPPAYLFIFILLGVSMGTEIKKA